MSVVDSTAPHPSGSISFELELRHAPEKVWRALTDPVLLAEWLLPVLDLKLETGAAFTFKTQAYPGWDGTVSCRFVEIEPLRTLSYTWDVPFLATVVTFTLTPTASGTRLSVVQSGFQPDQKQELGGARYGWAMMRDKLVDLLERILMNIALWILQALLALHTAVGAVWKFSNSEQAVPSLNAIPHQAWMVMSVLELLCSAGLVLAALHRPLAILVPIAAAGIALEMLLFTGLHLRSGDANHGPIAYWLVVAAVCAFVAVGRLSIRPL